MYLINISIKNKFDSKKYFDVFVDYLSKFGDKYSSLFYNSHFSTIAKSIDENKSTKRSTIETKAILDHSEVIYRSYDKIPDTETLVQVLSVLRTWLLEFEKEHPKNPIVLSVFHKEMGFPLFYRSFQNKLEPPKTMVDLNVLTQQSYDVIAELNNSLVK